MSLYDDIDIDKKDIGDSKSDVSGWSVGHRLLNTQQSKSKKSSSSALNSSSSSYSKKRQSSSMAPVVNLAGGGGGGGGLVPSYGGGGSSANISAHDGEIRFNHITGKMESGPVPKTYAQFGVKCYPPNTPFADMSIEYDPSFPNEYADFSRRLKKMKNQEREREEQEKENERKRESEERQRKREDERREKLEKIAASFRPPTSLYSEAPKETESTKRLALYDSSSDEEDDKPTNNSSSGAQFAPPPMLIEESKPMTPPPNPMSFAPPSDEIEPPGGFVIEGKGGSIASKIMAKMGYKHGGGLGRDEQGMSMALQVEKTSRRGGKILHEKDIATKEMTGAGAPVKADTGITNTELLRNPSKVLLLTNMVGPGEVDEELEPETAEECSKYGKVIKCVIYEVPNVPEILAVRIFVEFEKISFAIKAAIDLNGRFFGGRVVRASFYSHEKFLQMKLDEDPL